MVVTRGGVAVQAGDAVADPAVGAVWGLLRSAQLENPGRFVLADLPADGGDGEVAALLYRAGQRRARGGRPRAEGLRPSA